MFTREWLAEIINDVLDKTGMDYKDFAARAKVSRTTIYKILNTSGYDNIRLTNVRQIIKVAEEQGIVVDPSRKEAEWKTVRGELEARTRFLLGTLDSVVDDHEMVVARFFGELDNLRQSLANAGVVIKKRAKGNA